MTYKQNTVEDFKAWIKYSYFSTTKQSIISNTEIWNNIRHNYLEVDIYLKTTP